MSDVNENLAQLQTSHDQCEEASGMIYSLSEKTEELASQLEVTRNSIEEHKNATAGLVHENQVRVIEQAEEAIGKTRETIYAVSEKLTELTAELVSVGEGIDTAQSWIQQINA